MSRSLCIKREKKKEHKSFIFRMKERIVEKVLPDYGKFDPEIK